MITISRLSTVRKPRKRINRRIKLLSELYGLPYLLVKRIYHRHIPMSSDIGYDTFATFYSFRLSLVKQELSKTLTVVNQLDFIDEVNYCY